ncbi:hypothetical protein PA598K_04064 [Paenibacillus sp. 598K]|uniref:hypothetical protein n=1 Tax=Paenibacillus sp. 598K TaxID=1117987 RepID=UPI000FFAAEFC|nr:hypothetical protein [Paenibacillus sp. 598K]GBF75644.1 hypothetical protein PA598K_04064 [Paenibacillus sp. 598K]
MKRTNRLVLMTATAVLAVSLAACGGGANKPLAPGSNVENNQPDPGNQPVEAPTFEGIGLYKGQIDNNSIEIETENGAEAFRLAEGMDQLLDELEDDARVAYTYEEHPVEGDDTVKQLILTKLERAEDANGGAGGTEGASSELPQTKTLTVNVEGETEQREAKLATADGYALYVLEALTFDAAANKLASAADETLSAVITKLPSDYNADMLRLEATEKLEQIGEVRELEGEEALSGAVIHLSAASAERGSQYIVKEVDGQGYIFEIETVQSEAQEGFEPAVRATLDSLVNQ